MANIPQSIELNIFNDHNRKDSPGGVVENIGSGRMVRFPAMTNLHDPVQQMRAMAGINHYRSMSDNSFTHAGLSGTGFGHLDGSSIDNLSPQRRRSHGDGGSPCSSNLNGSKVSIQAVHGSPRPPAFTISPSMTSLKSRGNEDWPLPAVARKGPLGRSDTFSTGSTGDLTPATPNNSVTMGNPGSDDWHEVRLTDGSATVIGSYDSANPKSAAGMDGFGRPQMVGDSSFPELPAAYAAGNATDAGDQLSMHVHHKFGFTLIPIQDAQKQAHRFNNPLLPEMRTETPERPRNPTPHSFSGLSAVIGRARKRTITFSEPDGALVRDRAETANGSLLAQQSLIDGAIVTGPVHPGASVVDRPPTPYPGLGQESSDANNNAETTQRLRVPTHHADLEARGIAAGYGDVEAAQTATETGRGGNGRSWWRRYCPARRPTRTRNGKQCWIICGVVLAMYWVVFACAWLSWKHAYSKGAANGNN